MVHGRRLGWLAGFGGLLALAACTSAGPTFGLGAIADQATVLGEPVAVTVTITGTPPAAVTVSATSSDQTMVPNAGLDVTGSGTTFTLTITPSSATTGTATITVTAAPITRTFVVTVEQPFSETGTEITGLNSEPVGPAVAISSDYIVAGGVEYAYVFWRIDDEWKPMAKLTASDAGAGQGFGRSVAVFGDVIVVGSDTHGGGAAYVFERIGNSWTEVKKLFDPVAAIGDAFGKSVAVGPNYIVVGANGDENLGVDSGSAFVFYEQAPDGWSLYGKLGPTNPTDDDVFGHSVDIDGAYLIGGNYGGNNNGAQAGQATIFRLDGGAWVEDDELDPVELEAEDQFGLSVALSGEYALVGSPGDDDEGLHTGAAYVFQRGSGGWQQVDKLVPPDATDHENFGGAVALDLPYAVIGAANDDSPVSRAGSVYVYRFDGTTWHLVAELDAPSPVTMGHFGSGVGVAGQWVVGTGADVNTVVAVYDR